MPVQKNQPQAPVSQAMPTVSETPPPAAGQPSSVPPAQSAPQPLAQNTTKPRRGFPKKLLIFIFLLFLLAAGAFAFTKLQNSQPTQEQINNGQEPKEGHVFEDYPDFEGIPIGEDTISFVKADGKFCLLYRGVVYLPQDTGVFVPKSMEETEEMASFPWIGLVDAPNNLASKNGARDAVFSFKESPSNKSFVFIMRWDTLEGEKYHMIRFNNNIVSELRVFSPLRDGLYYAPKLHLFSQGGNYLNLNMFSCPNCLSEQPETLLYYIPSGDTRKLGPLSHFEWLADDNTYEYKVVREGVDPKDVQIQRNEFFEESIDLLSP